MQICCDAHGPLQCARTFQKVMHHAMGDLLDKFVFIYLDAILVYSPSE